MTHHYLTLHLYQYAFLCISALGIIKYTFYQCVEKYRNISVQEEPREYYVSPKLWTMQSLSCGEWRDGLTKFDVSRRIGVARAVHCRSLYAAKNLQEHAFVTVSRPCYNCLIVAERGVQKNLLTCRIQKGFKFHGIRPTLKKVLTCLLLMSKTDNESLQKKAFKKRSVSIERQRATTGSNV